MPTQAVAAPILSPSNGQSLPLTTNTKSNGLLTTSDKTLTTPLAVSVAETTCSALPPPPPPPPPPAAAVAADKEKEDSSLDAELLALAAQQMRSPTTPLAHTPTPNLKADKCNPAKWSVSLTARGTIVRVFNDWIQYLIPQFVQNWNDIVICHSIRSKIIKIVELGSLRSKSVKIWLFEGLNVSF